MSRKFERRHSRWYEVVFFSSIFQFFVGYLVVAVFPSWLNWGNAFLAGSLGGVQLNTLAANSLAFLIVFVVLNRLKRYPGTRSLAFIIPTVVFSWFSVFAALLFMREEAYSRPVLFYAFALANFAAFAGYFVIRRYRQSKLAIVPFGRALEISNIALAALTVLAEPDLEGRRYDGVVADLHAADLPDEWERFLARCTLARIPVYHTQQLTESLTGRVKVEHLSENTFGSLQPSVFFGLLKRVFDFIGVFLLFPILLPVMLVTVLAIKLDSKGSVFYVQKRMGYRGIAFNMYKFRSMIESIDGAGFTQNNGDPRITKIGVVIRKYRIDELPQLLNILKGEMSFIGPRPESLELSNWYEKDVPFFSYRHIVRPGLSGWAQVNQGYAAEVDGMTVKLQYDFYYIKNFSLWLDILIAIKTIRTVFTGFGSR